MLFFFFFKEEDGIRFLTVTGVQTCALPIGELSPPVPAMTEAYAWATNLFAAAGDFERVRAALAAFSARLAVRLEPAQAYAATVTLLSGSESGPIAPVVLPDGLRRAVREALRAELARYPGDPLLGTWLRTLSAALPNR